MVRCASIGGAMALPILVLVTSAPARHSGDASTDGVPAHPVVAAAQRTADKAATTFAELDSATRTGILDAMRAARTVANDDTVTFANPEQQLHAAFTADGITIGGRDETRVQFTEPRMGRDGALIELTALSAGSVAGVGTTEVTIARQAGDVAVTEWWRNRPDGIEQGFTVMTRPSGDGTLEVEQPWTSALSAEASADGGVAFRQDGQVRLQFGGVRAWDATGRALPAHMRVDAEASALTLVVDDATAAYPITVDPVWSQQAYLKASNTGQGDQFGGAVAISGNTVVVGAISEDSNATGVNGSQSNNSAILSGAAYVFVRSGATWSQQAYLKASNTGPGDEFGWSVAIAGDTVVVGAHFESSNATGVNGDQANNLAGHSGAVYVFVRTGTTWTQQAYLKASNTANADEFGQSVAVSGDTVVVGAHYEDSNATGIDGNQSDNSAPYAGAAYVFVRTGTTWSQQAYLKASNTAEDDFFGLAVAVAGDTAVIGAFGESSNATGVNGNQADNSAVASGAAYVFVRTGTVWSQQAYLKASNTEASDLLGSAVAVNGETIVVGATGEDSSATGVNGHQANGAFSSGAAYVFVRNGTTWSQEAYLKASNTQITHAFGGSVAVDGDAIVVGASQDPSSATGVNGNQADNSAPSSGAAYVFVRTGTSWTQQAYLKASNTEANDVFGRVAIAGSTVVVGARNEGGSATGVNGDQTNNGSFQSGAAYVFTLAGTDVVTNGSFAGGTTGWNTFSLPTVNDITFNVTNGVFQFYRSPTGTQAVVFQNTGAGVAANTPITAQFRLGNSDSVRKRISVLVHDSDFSDLFVCTYWLPANAPMQLYTMQTHTTKTWANASISFYAATAGSGGFYQFDDVSLLVGAGTATETICTDPRRPTAPGGAAGPELVANGTFSAGLAPWTTFGTITGTVNGGVFEFVRNAGMPAGVVLQGTGQPVAVNQIVSATFELGNSSAVRKRVTVILHDNNFADLSACTFWLAPGLPLSTFTMRTYTTLAWTNATFSVYGATVGPEQWIRLDNVSLQRTPALTTPGTLCVEPGGSGDVQAALDLSSLYPTVPLADPRGSIDGWDAEGFHRVDGTGRGWIGRADSTASSTLAWTEALDLTTATAARLTLASWVMGSAVGRIEVTTDDGSDWTTVHVVHPSDGPVDLAIDLAAYLGERIRLRFVLDATADDVAPGLWLVEDVEVQAD